MFTSSRLYYIFFWEKNQDRVVSFKLTNLGKCNNIYVRKCYRNEDFRKSIEIATQLRNAGINTQIYTNNAK